MWRRRRYAQPQLLDSPSAGTFSWHANRHRMAHYFRTCCWLRHLPRGRWWQHSTIPVRWQVPAASALPHTLPPTQLSWKGLQGMHLLAGWTHFLLAASCTMQRHSGHLMHALLKGPTSLDRGAHSCYPHHTGGDTWCLAAGSAWAHPAVGCACPLVCHAPSLGWGVTLVLISTPLQPNPYPIFALSGPNLPHSQARHLYVATWHPTHQARTRLLPQATTATWAPT